MGARAIVGPHAFIERDTYIAEDVRISKGAVLGSDPQDLKYGGERTLLSVGPRSVVREFATLNRGTAATGSTVVGADCLLMAYVHVAHDCRLGDHVVLTNAVTMGGHVEIGDWAIVGGMTPIHQFTRIGRHAMVGGAARIDRDVAPYTLVGGSPTYTYGINRIGLERRGFGQNSIRALQSAYREIFGSGQPLSISLERRRSDYDTDEVRDLVAFIRESSRGITPRRFAGLEKEEELPGLPSRLAARHEMA